MCCRNFLLTLGLFWATGRKKSEHGFEENTIFLQKVPKFPSADWLIAFVKKNTIKMMSDVTGTLSWQ